MAINTLAAATLFMQQLDKIAVQDAVTGWMDANSGQVIYNGGDEVKVIAVLSRKTRSQAPK